MSGPVSLSILLAGQIFSLDLGPDAEVSEFPSFGTEGPRRYQCRRAAPIGLIFARFRAIRLRFAAIRAPSARVGAMIQDDWRPCHRFLLVQLRAQQGRPSQTPHQASGPSGRFPQHAASFPSRLRPPEVWRNYSQRAVKRELPLGDPSCDNPLIDPLRRRYDRGSGIRPPPPRRAAAGQFALYFRILYVKLANLDQCSSKSDQRAPCSWRTWRFSVGVGRTLAQVASVMQGIQTSRSQWPSATRRGGSGPGSSIISPMEGVVKGLLTRGVVRGTCFDCRRESPRHIFA